VIVNRQWAAFFGEGLVRTVADFGLQSDSPSHPELLDWLALEFLREGWSLKKLNRLLVTSETYKQSSVVTTALLEVDLPNRWLARAPRPRLEAEMIRDSVLKVSGLLSPKMFGPGVFPPQPPGITTEGTYGAMSWNVSGGEDRYRRGLYTYAKRTAPYAMSGTFDAPSGEACLARRDVSNTALQALTLLNDQVLMDAARALGRSLSESNRETSEAAGEMVRLCLNRDPSPGEITKLVEFWRTQRDRFASGGADPASLAGEGKGPAADRAAWVALARVLLNTDEFVTRN
jgi:hypothetical protein